MGYSFEPTWEDRRSWLEDCPDCGGQLSYTTRGEQEPRMSAQATCPRCHRDWYYGNVACLRNAKELEGFLAMTEARNSYEVMRDATRAAEEEELLTTQAAADLLGVHYDTLVRWWRKRDLISPIIQPNGYHKRWRRSEIERLRRQRLGLDSEAQS